MTVLALALVGVAAGCLIAVIAVPITWTWRGGDRRTGRRMTLLIRYLWYGALLAMIGAATIWPGLESGSDRLVAMLAVTGGATLVMGVTKSAAEFVLRRFVPRGPGSRSGPGVPSKSRVGPLRSGLRPAQ